ncbi:MAG: hypothetical protein PHR53_02620 [Bacteroidales bacterium]|nr:hypothetical protein [Bacteroidales bacterium]
MADKYQNKYRIASTRASWHAYDGGVYFVTICTKNRVHYFGEITSEPQMQLSEIGKCTVECWNAIPTHFPHVELGSFVVMPDHIHGIIIINPSNDIIGTNVGTAAETQDFASKNTETQDFASKNTETQDFASQQKFGPQSRNLASVIRGFKIGVTKYAHTNNIEFAWQTRFHDHIVRNQEELNRIAHYIENNIARWANDKLKKTD